MFEYKKRLQTAIVQATNRAMKTMLPIPIIYDSSLINIVIDKGFEKTSSQAYNKMSQSTHILLTL